MTQTWNADQYSHHAPFVATYGEQVLALLGPVEGQRILDLGCGDGFLTEQIQASGADVHGVDASASMIRAAQKRGLSAEVASGEALNFVDEFDAVFSNAALHWMKNSAEVISGVHRALKPKGRFVGEFGGEGNVEALVNAMKAVFRHHRDFGEFVNPWYFPSVSEYQSALENQGFLVDYIELIPRPTPLESGIVHWLNIFSNGITGHLSPSQISRFLTEVEELLKPVQFVNNQWMADYVRLRFSATKA